MRKLLFSLLVVTFFSSSALADTFADPMDLYATVTSTTMFSWEHVNPAELPGGPYTPEQYTAAVEAGIVTSATVTLVLDTLELGNEIDTWVQDKDLVWHNVGLLNTMTIAPDGLSFKPLSDAYEGHHSTTTFDLEPGWLNGLPVAMMFTLSRPLFRPFQVETSTLVVTLDDTFHTPAPAAVLLGMLGLGIAGLKLRKYA